MNRTKPHTINGKTYNVPVDEPLDLDALADRVIVGITGFVLVGAVTWSTLSIGELLSPLTFTWTAYLVAAVFDLLWVAFMLLEFRNRFDAKKRRLPMWGGWLALLVSMAAVFAHGLQVAGVVVAIFGAVISLMAKSLWAMTMAIHTRKLSREDARWLAQARDEQYMRRAIAVTSVEMVRAEQRVQAIQARTSTPEQLASSEHEQPSTPEQPARPLLAQPSSSVLTGHEQRAGTPSIAEQARELLASGASRDDVVASILRALPDAKPESVKAEVRRQAKKLDEGTGLYL
ncbi:hypothetical protein [Streptosporangium sp. NPDC020145]|uniref:hypothetical protein n=1 Tax=Streptosporangium sp. NPDC020145 TaxID=3154694 RepID=UPI0034125A72